MVWREVIPGVIALANAIDAQITQAGDEGKGSGEICDTNEFEPEQRSMG